MSFAPGTRWGVYEVVALLGSGAMGEVYRARDTRLHRDVAIKVLRSRSPPIRTGCARFEREARLLAALNHPHIAHGYGLEESSGVPALVMELVEGDARGTARAEARCRTSRRSRSPGKSARRSKRRTSRASSTAI